MRSTRTRGQTEATSAANLAKTARRGSGPAQFDGETTSSGALRIVGSRAALPQLQPPRAFRRVGGVAAQERLPPSLPANQDRDCGGRELPPRRARLLRSSL